MNAQVFSTNQSSNFDKLSQDKDNVMLLNTLFQFTQMMRGFGIDMPVSSRRSLEKLGEMDSDKKKSIADGFRQSMRWIAPLATLRDLHVSAATERECVQMALDHSHLNADPSFWKTFQDGDVIEVYGLDMKQIYRGLNFYRYSGYSALDISVYEWYVLWERPKMIIDLLGREVETVIKNSLDVYNFTAPKHVLRETLNTGCDEKFSPRACLMQFKTAGALRSIYDNSVGGFICTSRGEIIAEGSDAMTIEFV